MFAYGESITRLRPQTSTDPYSGELAANWTLAPNKESTGGWGVDGSRSAEPLESGRDPVVTDFVLYRPEPADILPGDRLVIRGLTCEVVGRPAVWHHPMTGWAAGFVVRADIKEG